MVSERIQRRIDRLLDQIEEAADESNWALVRDRSEQVLSFDPGNVDGLAFLAAAMQQRRYLTAWPIRDVQSAYSLWAIKFVRGKRQQIHRHRAHVQRHLASGLGCIAVIQHIALPANRTNRGYVLNHAGLIVHVHNGHQLRIRSNGRFKFCQIQSSVALRRTCGRRGPPAARS